MIFLIDDKVSRQLDYGWSKDRFDQFTNNLKVLYNYDEIEEFDSVNIFKEGNTVLFHESFFDNVKISQKEPSLKIRKKLTDFAVKNIGFELIYFSGNKISRKLDNNIGSMPVSVLYDNLETYAIKYAKNEGDLKHLLFGDNFSLEKELIDKFNEQASKYNT